MALVELSKDQNATQFVTGINGNIQEVGGSASVNADGSAAALVDALNDVFEGVADADELSADDNAADFVDALNANFEAAADSTPQVRELEDSLVLDPQNTNTTVPFSLKKGEQIMLMKKDVQNPIIYPSAYPVTIYYMDGGVKKSWTETVIGVWTSSGDYNEITVGNSSLRASTIANDGYMISKSRSRCYKNPAHRWVVFGDSLSVMTAYQKQNGDYVDVGAGYSYVLGESNHDIAVNNRAYSGSTIMYPTTGVWDRAHATNFEPYDICSILIGSNDFGYNTPVNDFVTQYSNLIDYIKGQKPSIKLFICTPIKRGDMTTNAQGATLADFCNAIKEVGQEKNVPVLDLYTLCAGTAIDFTVQENANTWSGHAENNALVHDKLHPIQEAHRLYMAPWFKSFMVAQGFVEDW